MQIKIAWSLLFSLILFSTIFVGFLISSRINHLADAIEKKDVDPYHDSYWEDPLLERNLILTTHAISALTSQRIISQLLYLNAKNPGKPITLILKTLGGSSSDCMAIIDTMKMISSPVNVVAIGRTSSSGAFLLAAGTGERVATSNSIIGIHMVFPQYELDKTLYSSEQPIAEFIRKFWAENAKLPGSFFPKEGDKLNKIFYLNADDALEFKVIDRIIDTNSAEFDSLFNFQN